MSLAFNNITIINGHISNHTTTTWNNGDLITADKLNNLENATKNGLDTLVLDVNIDPTESDEGLSTRTINITNATAQDLINAFNNGTNVIILVKKSVNMDFVCSKMPLINYSYTQNDKYVFKFSLFTVGSSSMFIDFTASSLNDYPSYTAPSGEDQA